MRTQRTCLVLGGKGFIGSHLVEALAERGYRVRSFDRPNVTGLASVTSAHIEDMVGDFCSESDVAAAVQGCDVCFHLVSTTLPRSSNQDPAFDVESNLTATVRLLRHAAAAGVGKVVFASSGGTVYGRPRAIPIPEDHPTDPLCSYGITKLAIEKYLGLYRELHGMRSVALRLANPYGERQRVAGSQGAVAVFLGRTLKGEPIEVWGDGSVVRDYLHISDVIEAFLLAMDHDAAGVFNIGSGRGVSVVELLDAIERVTGRSPERRHLPARAFDVPANVLDTRLAAQLLGWSPRLTFEEGLARTWEWMRLQG